MLVERYEGSDTLTSVFHFIMECECNSELRHGLFDKMCNQYKNFVELNQLEKFIYLFTLEDNQALTWLGKFIYKSFEIRLDLQNSVWISCSVISLETIYQVINCSGQRNKAKVYMQVYMRIYGYCDNNYGIDLLWSIMIMSVTMSVIMVMMTWVLRLPLLLSQIVIITRMNAIIVRYIFIISFYSFSIFYQCIYAIIEWRSRGHYPCAPSGGRALLGVGRP